MHTAWSCTASLLVTLVPGASIAEGQATTSTHEAAQAPVSASRASDQVELQAKASELASKAIAWLRTQQDPTTGGWSIREGAPVFPAISALVLSGMLMDPLVGQDDATVQAGIKFLLNSQQPDGGIYVGLLPSYNTAISLSALARVQSPPQVASARARAVEFLKTIQYGEGAIVHEGLSESAKVVTKDDPYYGGWGYGNRGRPDLSNSAFAIEALRAAGVPETDPVFERALVFLQRCQMQERGPHDDAPHDDASPPPVINDMPYAAGSNQGGFIYATAINKDSGGVGQSFAGEIVESLSGPAGSVTTVTLAPALSDGKPVTLSRDVIATRVQRAINDAVDLSRGIVPTEFIIVLGPTSDAISASSFSIRSNAAPQRMATLLREVFASELAEAGSVQAQAVDQWKGTVRLRAYGSISYAGFKSMAYAGLSRDDPRVQGVLRWIGQNYVLSENPGMGTDGYYYYLLMFGRAMAASGLDVIPLSPSSVPSPRDPLLSGNWRADLIRTLATLQQDDGSFRAVDDRWMENDPVLITAYSLIALQSARQ